MVLLSKETFTKHFINLKYSTLVTFIRVIIIAFKYGKLSNSRHLRARVIEGHHIDKQLAKQTKGEYR